MRGIAGPASATLFAGDVGVAGQAEEDDARQRPMATVFTRRDGTVRHFWSSELFMAPMEPGQSPRHIDFMWPLWAVLDTTPAGRAPVWYPSLSY